MLVSPTLVRMQVPVLFKETVVTRALVLLDIVETTVKLQQVTHIPLHGKQFKFLNFNLTSFNY